MAFLLGAIDKHLRGMKQTFGGGESDAVGRGASAGYGDGCCGVSLPRMEKGRWQSTRGRGGEGYK